ncbi:MAG: Uma2 family endonuclease [Cyanobacteria bacterium J06598_1]
MTARKPTYVEQRDPPLSPRLTLPTMYDLPSEDPEEPGLPDEFHALQPGLLSATLQLADYPEGNYFTGTDMNLYYDVHHQGWYKRPDWFLSVGVSRLYDGHDLRLSYVIWQEGISPFVAVELLSPGTEKEDLGETQRRAGKPPTKWEVYEKILRVPYYIAFDRYSNRLRAFHLQAGSYQPLTLPDNKLWIPELKIGIGSWNGAYQGVERLWLRCFDEAGLWIKTPEERAIASAKRAAAETQKAELAAQQAAAETQRAELAAQQAAAETQRAELAESALEALKTRLRNKGIDPDSL